MKLSSFTIDWAFVVKYPLWIAAFYYTWETPVVWILVVMAIAGLKIETKYESR